MQRDNFRRNKALNKKNKNNHHDVSSQQVLQIKGIKHLKPQQFYIYPKKQKMQEYLNYRFPQQKNNRNQSKTISQNFMPAVTNIKFKLKPKKIKRISKTCDQKIDSKLSHLDNWDKSVINLEQGANQPNLLLQNKNKTIYAHSFGYMKHMQMNNTLSTLKCKNHQLILCSPLKKQLMKNINKTSPLKSSPQLRTKGTFPRNVKVLYDSPKKQQKQVSNDKNFAATTDNFLISRKKLGERGLGLNKITKSDREDIAIIQKFRKAVRQNRKCYVPLKEDNQLLINNQSSRQLCKNDILPWDNLHQNPQIL